MLTPRTRFFLVIGWSGALLLTACDAEPPRRVPAPTTAPAQTVAPPAIGTVLGRPVADGAPFDSLLAPDARLETIATGFSWTEGPLWVPAQRALLFSHAPTNEVWRWTAATGARPWLKPSGYTGTGTYSREPGSNGLALNAAGQLVLCQHGNRRVAVRRTDGTQQALAATYEGHRFNSPNDLVFRRATGDLYFTDPPYGLPHQEADSSRELPFQGVFRREPNGRVTLLTKELSRPNGVALSPDERTLYVTNSDPARAVVLAFPLTAAGAGAGAARVFHDFTALTQKVPGLPDGLKTDHAGNVYICGPGGLHVFAPDGKHLGLVRTAPNLVSNCAWGDARAAAGSFLSLPAGTTCSSLTITALLFPGDCPIPVPANASARPTGASSVAPGRLCGGFSSRADGRNTCWGWAAPRQSGRPAAWSARWPGGGNTSARRLPPQTDRGRFRPR